MNDVYWDPVPTPPQDDPIWEVLPDMWRRKKYYSDDGDWQNTQDWHIAMGRKGDLQKEWHLMFPVDKYDVIQFNLNGIINGGDARKQCYAKYGGFPKIGREQRFFNHAAPA